MAEGIAHHALPPQHQPQPRQRASHCRERRCDDNPAVERTPGLQQLPELGEHQAGSVCRAGRVIPLGPQLRLLSLYTSLGFQGIVHGPGQAQIEDAAEAEPRYSGPGGHRVCVPDGRAVSAQMGGAV